MNNLYKMLRALILLVVCLLLKTGTAYSIELMSPATQLGTKKVHAEIYFRTLAKQDLSLNVGGNTAIRVGASTITSSSSSDLEPEGSGDGVFAKVTFQPFESGLRYYFIGGTGGYHLKVPSGTFSNTYSSDNPGFVLGGGIKYTIVPHTVVNPAFSVDLSATHSHYKLVKFHSGDGKASGDTGYLLTILELQGAFTISKKFLFPLGDYRASIDPYAGVKVIRTRTDMADLGTGSHFSGTRLTMAPFFGFKFKPFPYEGLVVEGSVFNETSASIGLTLGF